MNPNKEHKGTGPNTKKVLVVPGRVENRLEGFRVQRCGGFRA